VPNQPSTALPKLPPNLPPDLEAYRRTPIFDEATVPRGLLHRHTTKAGVWGRIEVLEGELVFRVLEPVVREERLSPARDGIVEPEVPHEVELVGPVRFFVEFLRRPPES
jgi:tellurite resistance-related uncharacterized protein